MATEWLYALGSVTLVSLVSLVGVATLAISESNVKRLVFFLVSLATGALFGDALLHLLPEAFNGEMPRAVASFGALAGILSFFVLEKFLRWRHEHVVQQSDNAPRHLGLMNLAADGLHNLIDGMLIGASYLAGPRIGFTTTVAVILHELPQEMGDFGILLHAGFSRMRALQWNFLSACLAFLGALLALLIGSAATNFPAYMLPFTAGGFIYVAGSDLVPELQRETDMPKAAAQFIGVVAGVGLMALLMLLE
jgi:zinc and cadmium transporter